MKPCKKQRRQKCTRESKDEKRRILQEKTIKQLKEIRERYKKIKTKKKRKIPTKKEDMEPWGDVMTTTCKWPNETEDKTICIFGQNVNGLSYANQYIEWEMALQYLDEFQVDVACLCEPNLDLNKPAVMEQQQSRLKKIDPHARMAKSVSPLIFSQTHFKMGEKSLSQEATGQDIHNGKLLFS